MRISDWSSDVCSSDLSLFADSILFTAPGNVSMLSAGAMRAAGDLTILAGGHIDLANGSAAVAGGDLTLSGQGIDAFGLTSGGGSMLDAGAGNLVVTDIASAGAITAAGALVNLGSSGAMNVAQAVA